MFPPEINLVNVQSQIRQKHTRMTDQELPHMTPNSGSPLRTFKKGLREPMRDKGELDQIDIVSEILFGLIMALTFTCTLRVAVADRTEVRDMLIAALGCNVVWGLVDAVMYIVGLLSQRGRGRSILTYVANSTDHAKAREFIADSLPPVVASSIGEKNLEEIRLKLLDIPAPSLRVRIQWIDIWTAIRIFFLVFLSTFPVALPFIFIHDVPRALRTSNAIAVIFMFICGYLLGRYGNQNRLLTGLTMSVLGILLVGLAIALGG